MPHAENPEEPGPGPKGPGAGTRRPSPLSRIVAWGVVGALALLVVVLGLVISARQRRILAEREKAGTSERPPVSVVVAPVRARMLEDAVVLPGTVEPWDDVWVSAEVAGTVVRLEIREGQTIARGAPLCRIDDRDYAAGLDQSTAARDMARSALGLAELQFERMARLRADGTVGQAEYDSAEAAVRQAAAAVRQAESAIDRAKLALDRTVVRAPLEGVVTKLPVSVGTLLSPGGRVARIVDTREVKIAVGIPERDILAVGRLEEVEVTLSAVPGREFTGKRIYLGVEPEENARTYRMELAVENPDGVLRPGMFAKARIVRGEPRQAVVIPLLAVIPREKDRIVFVERDGRARRRVVELGALLGGRLEEARVEVISGLADGDRLIIIGQRQVEDGDRVVAGEMPEALRELMR